MEYSDIHTHILFGIDDGAPSLDVSLELLDRAYADGTRRIILTPHGTGRLDTTQANEALEVLRKEAGQRYPDLSLLLGCEIMYGSTAIDGLNNGLLPTLADSHYVLVEYGTRVFYGDLMDSVRLFTMNGYLPIIAHAERYECMSFGLSYQLVDAGAYIQLNASAVLGSGGFKNKRLCAELLKHKLVHFVASDAHDPQRRLPILSKAYSYVSRKYGGNYANLLFDENGRRIIEHKVIGGN